MIDWDRCFQKIQSLAPSLARELAGQSAQVRQQFLNLLAEHAGFVSREEFERQKDLYTKLLDRCEKLQQSVENLKANQSPL